MGKRWLFIILFISSITCFADDLRYGLFFKSFAVPGNERTSLTLDGGDYISLDKDITTVSFDMSVRNEVVFGLISRIITDDESVIDLIFATDGMDKRYPALVVNQKIYPISNAVEFNKWIPVSLTFSKKDDILKLTYGTFQQKVSLSLNRSKKMQVSLGACRIKHHSWVDVAPINMKDVKISHDKKLIRHWELRQHTNNVCYDKVENAPANAENPYWLVNDHFQWKKIFSLIQKKPIQITFDPERSDFYIANSASILRFDPATDKTVTFPVSGGFMATDFLNQFLYDTISDRLVSYSLGDDVVSFFSLNDYKWSNDRNAVREPRYGNHSFSFSNDGKEVYMFGGYGYYQYNNAFFKMDLLTGKTERTILTDIKPRFSTSSALVGNTLYLFGGRGNRMGKQELSPQTFYDLYAVDLKTLKTKKLWNLSGEGDFSFIPGANMIYNETDHSFYVLTTEFGGVLIKIYQNSSKWEYVSGRINEPMLYKDLFLNLYYSKENGKLYSVFNKILNDGTRELSIYSLNFPPSDINEIAQAEKKNLSVFWFIGGSLFLIFLIVFIYFKWFKRTKVPNAFFPDSPQIMENEKVLESTFDRSKSAISLLGSFNVRDKKGQDITSSFTPRLKNLLILLIIYTEKEERGIVEKKLDDILWSDKMEDSARNNRNVTLRRLRVLLEQVGNVEIVNDNKFRKIVIGDTVFCDYHTALQYMAEAKAVDSMSEQSLNNLLELLLFGPLLPNTSADWLDDFKGGYSSAAIDLLDELLKRDRFKNNPKYCLRIVETIISHDMLNEEALTIKCTILYNSGKKGLAKNAYDNFCKEYKKSLGEDYKRSFSSVCEKNY